MNLTDTINEILNTDQSKQERTIAISRAIATRIKRLLVEELPDATPSNTILVALCDVNAALVGAFAKGDFDYFSDLLEKVARSTLILAATMHEENAGERPQE